MKNIVVVLVMIIISSVCVLIRFYHTWYLYLIQRRRTLIAVCCIDERVNELRGLLMKKQSTNVDVVGIIREDDGECKDIFQQLGAMVITVPSYRLKAGARHNMDGIAAQRTAALKFAREWNYDSILFLDSDIRPTQSLNVLVDRLSLGILLGADVVGVPYGVRWANMRSVIGREEQKLNNVVIVEEKGHHLLPFRRCAAVGMGCTMIDLHSHRVPREFHVGHNADIIGEDIGFCHEAMKEGARIWTPSAWWVSQPRHVR